jgi:hypothetical protein
MPITRNIAPGAASGRGGTVATSPAASVFGSLDGDAELSLYCAGNRGELPGEYSPRAQPHFEDQEPESPYWATWGF